MLPSTQTFIDTVLASYEANQTAQDEPETIFEGAHHPVPRHQGGKTKVALLKQHHAIHGVLQSAETQTCCVFGWEYDLILNGPFVADWFDLLDACDKWLSIGKSQAAKKLHSEKLPDGRSAHAVKAAKARYQLSHPNG